ncbi:hypothetical protein BAE44_0012057 [Dichanthelium oligosanthes]|uniref:Protein kinase domain-containing protein n=1 Tax=Dichanthelium oligosanthes TaxID=888268 RepID=A0A1E5VPC5_9POAL|nr:hypothetical protein BAE44_0012057 [Dichanthelium oligosanthes]
MSPEYLSNHMISKELFSLGVIIIEITTGHKHYPYGDSTSSHQEFIELVRKLLVLTFQIYDMISQVLNNWKTRPEKTLGYTPREIDCQKIRRCIEIGLLCVKQDRAKRPTMDEIIIMLQELEGAECSKGRGVRRLPKKANEDDPAKETSEAGNHAGMSYFEATGTCDPESPGTCSIQ